MVTASAGPASGTRFRPTSTYRGTLATLQTAIAGQRSFQLLLGSELGPHKLMKRARVLADYQQGAGDSLPDQLISTSFAIVQEWANQIGEQVLLSLNLDMGSPPINLFTPHRRNHPAYRDPELFPEIPLGQWYDITLVGSRNFLPLSCALCPLFTPADQVLSVAKEGIIVTVPSCEAHAPVARLRYQ